MLQQRRLKSPVAVNCAGVRENYNGTVMIEIAGNGATKVFLNIN